jgi:DNA-binding response OmpR family regulator
LVSLGRVLVVDDAAYVRDVLSEYLRDLGYEVDLAPDGDEAVARFDRARPHLVLLDLQLPGIPGQDVFAKMRASDPTVPIVILSANVDAGLGRALLERGAFDYLPKPWDFDALERVIAAAIASGASRREIA